MHGNSILPIQNPRRNEKLKTSIYRYNVDETRTELIRNLDFFYCNSPTFAVYSMFSNWVYKSPKSVQKSCGLFLRA